MAITSRVSHPTTHPITRFLPGCWAQRERDESKAPPDWTKGSCDWWSSPSRCYGEEKHNLWVRINNSCHIVQIFMETRLFYPITRAAQKLEFYSWLTDWVIGSSSDLRKNIIIDDFINVHLVTMALDKSGWIILNNRYEVSRESNAIIDCTHKQKLHYSCYKTIIIL